MTLGDDAIMSLMKPYYIRSGPFYILPIVHYRMEFAALARQAFLEIKPDCVAVELPETMQQRLVQAAARLPDVSVIQASDVSNQPTTITCASRATPPLKGSGVRLRKASRRLLH